MAQVLHHNVSVHEFVCEGLPSWGLGMGVAWAVMYRTLVRVFNAGGNIDLAGRAEVKSRH
jgi:hypothetical protein